MEYFSDHRPVLSSLPSRVGRSSHIVCKFGGTSVAKHLSTIVEEIVPSMTRCVPILVCSAQSYTVKAEGTTQCLFDSIDAVLGVGKYAPETLDIVEETQKLVDDANAKGLRDGKRLLANEGEDQNDLIAGAFDKLSMVSKPNNESSSSLSSDSDSSYISHGDLTPSSGSDAGYSSASSPPSSPPVPAVRSGIDQAKIIMAGVLSRHLAAAQAIVPKDGPILQQLQLDLCADCDQVLRWLTAVSALGEISERIRDSVASIGEIMACRTAVAALKARDVDARLLRLDDICSGKRPALTRVDPTGVLDVAFFDEICAAMRERILALSTPSESGKLPVLVATGFFGPVPGSLLRQVGRGYSDVCASLCARAVSAQELQIWKEVDGVFTADPRKIGNTKLLGHVSSKQAKLLASYGSEVVHPLAIDQAMRLKIPIVVRNVTKPSASGTRVVSTPMLPPLRRFASVPEQSFSVTLLNNLDMVHVHFDDWELSPGRAIGIVTEIIKEHTGVANVLGMDLLASSQRDVCFMLNCQEELGSSAEEGLRLVIDALHKLATVTVTTNLSYLQIVYMSAPSSAAGIASRALGALAKASIDVKMINCGPIGAGIGCVISQDEAARAASTVHDALISPGASVWM